MYIVYWNPPKARQITFEEILAGVTNADQLKCIGDKTSTKTVSTSKLNTRLRAITNIPQMIQQLEEFNAKHIELEMNPLAPHYRHFEIPKKSGGVRPIDAPDKELSDALVELRELLRGFMIADYHNAAYAYVPGRSTLKAVQKHQQGQFVTRVNPETGESERVRYENNFTASFDFHGFFPSTTLDFLMLSLNTIYPFSLIMQDAKGREQLEVALSLAFLNGGLPQGTPFSPWITNVMMIPFDHLMSRKLTKFKMEDGVERRFTYTRYADDIDVSCPLSFNVKEIQGVILKALEYINAPFTLNEKKTHYVNRHSCSNWMLGLQWGQTNTITVGHKNMKQFKAMLTYYVVAKKNKNPWELEDVQKLNGLISYYKMVEEDVVNHIIDRYNDKFKVDIMAMILDDLTPEEGQM